MKNSIKILNEEMLSNNWYLLKKLTYECSTINGSVEQYSREVYDRGNGAVILLYNQQKRTVVLTRQFRLPTYVNGNEDGLLIEACAGLLDKDNAEDCIRRETEEETGFRIDQMDKVFEAYMSPGSVTELLYFFIAAYTPAMKVAVGGGVPHEQENIEVLELHFDEVKRMMYDGSIRDGKTIILLQYLIIKGIL